MKRPALAALACVGTCKEIRFLPNKDAICDTFDTRSRVAPMQAGLEAITYLG